VQRTFGNGEQRGDAKRRGYTSEQGQKVDALATRADEGRGNAAKSSGEPLAGRSGDLRMGQPPAVMGGYSLVMRGEASGGTETSKYPEEKKQFP
jgi:hypothetical protein